MLETAIEKQMSKISKGYTFLATVGSTAPFIGLFGIVWGIMNSFQSIAISRNTSLAIVAPGIAEALFATALGLLAASEAVAPKGSDDPNTSGSGLDLPPLNDGSHRPPMPMPAPTSPLQRRLKPSPITPSHISMGTCVP